MDAIVNGKFALPQVRRPDLPNELSSIIMRALSVDPERRFQTADELRVALDQFVANYEMRVGLRARGLHAKAVWRAPRAVARARKPARYESKQLIQRGSWSDVASNVRATPETKPRAGAPRRRPAGARTRSRTWSSPPASSSTKVSPYETGPSMKFGWEASAPMQAVRNNKLWLAVPALALVGVWLVEVRPREGRAEDRACADACRGHAPHRLPRRCLHLPSRSTCRSCAAAAAPRLRQSMRSYRRAGARGRDRRSSEEERRAEAAAAAATAGEESCTREDRNAGDAGRRSRSPPPAPAPGRRPSPAARRPRPRPQSRRKSRRLRLLRLRPRRKRSRRRSRRCRMRR